MHARSKLSQSGAHAHSRRCVHTVTCRYIRDIRRPQEEAYGEAEAAAPPEAKVAEVEAVPVAPRGRMSRKRSILEDGGWRSSHLEDEAEQPAEVEPPQTPRTVAT